MSTLEKKYEAALEMLGIMTESILELPNPMEIALQQRNTFDASFAYDKELHAAGLAVARDMQEKFSGPKGYNE